MSFDRDAIVPLLDEEHSLLVRASAAIALWSTGPHDRALDILIEAVASGEALNEQSKELRFNIGNLVGFAELVISQARDDQREGVVAVLCRALRGVNAFQSCDVTSALLDLVIEDPRARHHFFKQRQPSQLTPLQHQAPQAILHHGGWGVGARRTARRRLRQLR